MKLSFYLRGERLDIGLFAEGHFPIYRLYVPSGHKCSSVVCRNKLARPYWKPKGKRGQFTFFCGKWFTFKNTRSPNWVAGCRNICYSLYKCERVCVCKYSRGGTNVYISPFHTQCQGQFFIGTFLHRPKHVRVHLPERIHASDKQRAFIQNKQQEPWKKRLRPQKLRLFRSTSISTSGLCSGFPWGGLCHSPLSWE